MERLNSPTWKDRFRRASMAAPLPLTLHFTARASATDCFIDHEQRWVGKASFYSEAGCVGCREDLIMANGERFEDENMTLAFMRLPLNSIVVVKNLDNESGVLAKVTDRGGFENHQLIGDVSIGVARALDFDLSRGLMDVEIAEYKCSSSPVD